MKYPEIRKNAPMNQVCLMMTNASSSGSSPAPSKNQSPRLPYPSAAWCTTTSVVSSTRRLST